MIFLDEKDFFVAVNLRHTVLYPKPPYQIETYQYKTEKDEQQLSVNTFFCYVLPTEKSGEPGHQFLFYIKAHSYLPSIAFAATRSLALRARVLPAISSSPGSTGFAVTFSIAPSRTASRRAFFTMRSSSEW